MKNISRRVFIKGMAVAAAATAASSVLAGCNLVPNTNEPVEVPGFQPVTKTLTNDDDTFTITAEKIGYTAANCFAVKMTMVNDLANDVTMLAANNGLKVVAYYDNQMAAQPATLYSQAAYGYTDNLYNGNLVIKHNDTGVSYKKEGSLYVDLANAPKDWKSVSLYFVLTDANGKSVSETTFTFNK